MATSIQRSNASIASNAPSVLPQTTSRYSAKSSQTTLQKVKNIAVIIFLAIAVSLVPLSIGFLAGYGMHRAADGIANFLFTHTLGSR